MSIKAKLKLLNNKKQRSDALYQKEQMLSPLEIMRHDVKEKFSLASEYRIAILKKLKTFAGMSDSLLLAVAESMQELNVEKGFILVRQDERGDAFFVIREGVASVTRKRNPRDKNEVPRELGTLHSNAIVGEISLVTDEVRTATVTVTSEKAKILKITRDLFTDIMSSANSISDGVRMKIAREALLHHPMMAMLTVEMKDVLLQHMTQMKYIAGNYICRQGSMAHAFYIVTEGLCGISITAAPKETLVPGAQQAAPAAPSGNGDESPKRKPPMLRRASMSDIDMSIKATTAAAASGGGGVGGDRDDQQSSSDEKDDPHAQETVLKRKLFPGDMFGESCMQPDNDDARYSANVYALETTYCMVVERRIMLSIVSKEMTKALDALQMKYEQHQHKLFYRGAHMHMPGDGGDQDMAHIAMHYQHGSHLSLHNYRRLQIIFSNKRRVSSLDINNKKHGGRVANFLRRLGKHMCESLYISMFSRLCAELYLRPERISFYGAHIAELFATMLSAAAAAVGGTVPTFNVTTSANTSILISTSAGSQLTSATLEQLNGDDEDGENKEIAAKDVIKPSISTDSMHSTADLFTNYDRLTIIAKIREFSMHILCNVPPDRRTEDEHRTIYGVLSQRNILKDTICNVVSPHATVLSSIKSPKSTRSGANRKASFLSSKSIGGSSSYDTDSGLTGDNTDPTSMQNGNNNNNINSNETNTAKQNKSTAEQWTQQQFYELCKSARGQRVISMETIFEYGQQGTCAYLILRGAIRVFTEGVDADTGRKISIFQEDLVTGEIFGETSLEGMRYRDTTAVALTPCDLLIIDAVQFAKAQSMSTMSSVLQKVTTDDKMQFLQGIPLFKSLKPTELLTLARLMKYDIVYRGKVGMRRGDISNNLCFVMNGKLDVVTQLPKKQRQGGGPDGNNNNNIKNRSKGKQNAKSNRTNGAATLNGVARNFMTRVPTTITSLQKYAYYGESGILNKWYQSTVMKSMESMIGSYNGKKEEEEVRVLRENFNAVGDTAVELLLLPAEYYYLLSDDILGVLENEFNTKSYWRHMRRGEFKEEIKEITYLQKQIAAYLDRDTLIQEVIGSQLSQVQNSNQEDLDELSRLLSCSQVGKGTMLGDDRALQRKHNSISATENVGERDRKPSLEEFPQLATTSGGSVFSSSMSLHDTASLAPSMIGSLLFPAQTQEERDRDAVEMDSPPRAARNNSIQTVASATEHNAGDTFNADIPFPATNADHQQAIVSKSSGDNNKSTDPQDHDESDAITTMTDTLMLTPSMTPTQMGRKRLDANNNNKHPKNVQQASSLVPLTSPCILHDKAASTSQLPPIAGSICDTTSILTSSTISPSRIGSSSTVQLPHTVVPRSPLNYTAQSMLMRENYCNNTVSPIHDTSSPRVRSPKQEERQSSLVDRLRSPLGIADSGLPPTHHSLSPQRYAGTTTKLDSKLQHIPDMLLSMYNPMIMEASCKNELEKRHFYQTTKQCAINGYKRAENRAGSSNGIRGSSSNPTTGGGGYQRPRRPHSNGGFGSGSITTNEDDDSISILSNMSSNIHNSIGVATTRLFPDHNTAKYNKMNSSIMGVGESGFSVSNASGVSRPMTGVMIDPRPRLDNDGDDKITFDRQQRPMTTSLLQSSRQSSSQQMRISRQNSQQKVSMSLTQPLSYRTPTISRSASSALRSIHNNNVTREYPNITLNRSNDPDGSCVLTNYEGTISHSPMTNYNNNMDTRASLVSTAEDYLPTTWTTISEKQRSRSPPILSNIEMSDDISTAVEPIPSTDLNDS